MRAWIARFILGLAFGGLTYYGAQHDWGFYSYLCMFFAGAGIASAGTLLENGNGDVRICGFRETIRYLRQLQSRFSEYTSREQN